MTDRKPTYNCRFVKGTGSGEQIEVVFAATDEGDLRTKLSHAVKVCEARLKASNTEVLEVADAVMAKVGEIRAAIRRDLENEGWLPPAGGASNGDAPHGPAHVRPDP